MVKGYKCFKKGLINQFGSKFEIGKVYKDDKEIRFQHGGFHMCTYLEDTLRYFDAFNEEIEIAEVIGYGKVDKYDDEYNEFFDMYSVENIIICHVLTHEEIINYAYNLPPMRLKRFLSLYRLNKNELELFRKKFYKDYLIMKVLDYYQDEDSNVYIKKK